MGGDTFPRQGLSCRTSNLGFPLGVSLFYGMSGCRRPNREAQGNPDRKDSDPHAPPYQESIESEILHGSYQESHAHNDMVS